MRQTPETTPPRDIDEYLMRIPEEAVASLQHIRRLIKEAAPKAREAISYQIPTFKYLGPLVGFGAAKNHCGFYVMSPAVMQLFSEELKPYDIATATIRFPFDKPLPDALIMKLVEARIQENEMIDLARKNKAKKKE